MFRACVANPFTPMLLRLSRASFWLAGLVAAWALVAPGGHETALTVVAGGGALLALALWRSALSADRRSYAEDAEVPPPAMLTGLSLADAAAAIARVADEAATQDAALRAIAAVLRAELGARTARIHDVLEVGEAHASLAEWLPESVSGASPSGAARRAPAHRVALAGSALGTAIATRRDVVALPQRVVVPFDEPLPDGTPGLALIELEGLEMALDTAALARLLDQARQSHRVVAQRRRAAAPEPAAAAETGGAAPDTRIRVLVVEDKVIPAGETARMLERLGCCVTAASGMLEELRALRATQFDLVLMDMHMPGIRAAAQASAAMRGTPTIVALAQHAPQVDAERLRELGFDDCLFKPFSPLQLQAMLDQHVRKRAPMSDNAGDGGGGGARPSAGAEVLDPAALARLRELDPSDANKLVERVLKAFQTSAARLLPQLETAHAANDRNTVRLVAHTLKSSSASIGATGLSQVCGELETLIRTDDGADMGPGVAAMTAALAAALQAIQRELDPTR
jgi:CheY-like chemotaxis protein/HPt (histidine-containing phosphotransfer) domain-containing protein